MTRQPALGHQRNALAARGVEVRAESCSACAEAGDLFCLQFFKDCKIVAGISLMFHILQAEQFAVCVWGLQSSWLLPSLHPCPCAENFLIAPCAGSPASHLPRLPPPGFSVSLPSTAHPLVASWPFNVTYPSLWKLEYSFCPRCSGISQHAFHSDNSLYFFLLFCLWFGLFWFLSSL